MGHQFSLAHLTVLQLTPPEMVRIAARTGYDFVSLRMTAITPSERTYPLMHDKKMMQETKALLADTGVKVLDIELARLGPENEPEDYQAFLEAGAELNARHVITQLPDPDRLRAEERLARLCDMAKPLGLTIDLEFPSWTETPNLDEATRILKNIDRDNAGLLIDTLHFDRSRSGLEDLKAVPREWFNFMHLCDAGKEIPDSIEGLIHTARSERFFPGEGGIDLRAILDCMPTVPYSLEIPNDLLMAKLGPEEYSRRAIRAAEHYLNGADTGLLNQSMSA